MRASKLKQIFVLVAAAVLLVVGSCYLTWKIARSRLAVPAVTFAQRDYPSVKFSQSQLAGSLRTESQSDSDQVRYQLQLSATSEDSRKTFTTVLNSSLSEALEFSLSLQDSAGFTLCEQKIYRNPAVGHDELVGRTDNAGNEIGLNVNSVITYCPADYYTRATKWSISTNYSAVMDAVNRSKTEK